jgi:hypothetical protein
LTPQSGSCAESSKAPVLALQKETRRSFLAGRQPISSFDGPYDGFQYREGIMPASGAASSRRSGTEFISTKWPRFFFMIVGLQALICVAFEAYVFGRFQSSLGTYKGISGDTGLDSQYRTIPTFLTLFIFGFLYQLLLTWDALRMKNTIQIIGICVANLALLIYTALQIDQIGTSISKLQAAGALNSSDLDLWGECRPFLVAIPIIIAVATIIMAYLAWELYREFAWDILKQIGADYRMKKRFLHYQVGFLFCPFWGLTMLTTASDLHCPAQVRLFLLPRLHSAIPGHCHGQD